MAGGIEAIASSISADFVQRLPRQNKKQREGLAQLIATMLDVRSANLMDLSASLPRQAERIDMRYQWISRLLGNERIDTDLVMASFAAEVLRKASTGGQCPVLIIDQTKANETQQAVVVAVRVGGRSLPISQILQRGASRRPKAPSVLPSRRPLSKWSCGCCRREPSRC